MWIDLYDAVTPGGPYVQGGGCTTVGSPAWFKAGGFGSCSKASARPPRDCSKAEVSPRMATCDRERRTHPDLFWASRVAAAAVGASSPASPCAPTSCRSSRRRVGTIRAHSNEAFRRLIARFFDFYTASLFNPHWGEAGVDRIGQHAQALDGLSGARPATDAAAVGAVLCLGQRGAAGLHRSPTSSAPGR